MISGNVKLNVLGKFIKEKKIYYDNQDNLMSGLKN
jgi:hypothetical protein